MFKIVYAGSVLAVANAHNWLEEPMSYNLNKASQAMPCPPKAADYVPMEPIAPGTPIPMKWTTNHGGTHFVKVAATMAELAAADKIVEIANPGATYTLALTNPGDYVVQYGWSGYYNCFDVTVAANAVPAAPCAGGASCALQYGRHSSCVNNACVCDIGATMTTVGNSTFCLTEAGSSKPNCPEYCRDALDWCIGSNAIYTSEAECLVKCSTFPIIESTEEPGTYPVLTTGNSLNCRKYHLHIEGGSPKDHCPHASYGGMDKAHCAGEGTEYLVTALVSIAAPLLNNPELAVANRLEDFLYGQQIGLPATIDVPSCAINVASYECTVVFSGPNADTMKSALLAKQTLLNTYMQDSAYLKNIEGAAVNINSYDIAVGPSSQVVPALALTALLPFLLF